MVILAFLFGVGPTGVGRRRTGDLIFTVSAIDIRRKGGDFEALVFDPESYVWTNPDRVEYIFYDGKFTAARVYWGMSRPFPYWWHFESDMNREQKPVRKF